MHDLIRGSPLEHALTPLVVGLVEAFEQRLQVTMAIDRDPQHLTLRPPTRVLFDRPLVTEEIQTVRSPW